MNREAAIKEFWRCLAKIKAIQEELEAYATRCEQKLRFIRDGIQSVQTEPDKLREEMNWR